MADDTSNYQNQLIEKIRENYLSIALGLLVLLVAVSIVIRSNEARNEGTDNAENESQEEQASQNEYVVKAGDSVSSIARDQLGSMDYTQAIIDTNSLSDPEKIEVGQVLILPDVEEGEVAGEDTSDDEAINADPTAGETIQPTQPAETSKGGVNGDGVTTTAAGSPITGDTYTVQKGDTLFTITVRAYNDSSMMRKVMNANRIWNANYIEAGTTLRLPR